VKRPRGAPLWFAMLALGLSVYIGQEAAPSLAGADITGLNAEPVATFVHEHGESGADWYREKDACHLICQYWPCCDPPALSSGWVAQVWPPGNVVAYRLPHTCQRAA
jgi:hypothetical protein